MVIGSNIGSMSIRKRYDAVASTGSFSPLSENALLRASLVARGEKATLLLVIDLTKMNRFWVVAFVGLEAGLYSFPPL